MDALQNTLRIGERLMVPEAKYPETAIREISAPSHVMLHIQSVLPAIEFDDELLGESHKIDDIGANRLLPPEFAAAELPAAQHLPETFFSLRHSPP